MNTCLSDSAYFDTDSHSMMVLTAWIPLVNADKVNGTLQVGQHVTAARVGPPQYIPRTQ